MSTKVRKAEVLAELTTTLSLCEATIQHSMLNREPSEMRDRLVRRAECLREAIRFIEENAIDEPS